MNIEAVMQNGINELKNGERKLREMTKRLF